MFSFSNELLANIGVYMQYGRLQICASCYTLLCTDNSVATSTKQAKFVSQSYLVKGAKKQLEQVLHVSPDRS